MKLGRVHGLIGGGIGALLLVLAVPAKRREAVPVPAPVALALRSAASSIALTVDASRLEAQRSRTASSEWGRDPFARERDGEPEVELAVALDPTTLSSRPLLGGVSRVGSAWLALIDGELARTGEQLSSGHIVVEITAESVTLRRSDEELTVKLGETR